MNRKLDRFSGDFYASAKSIVQTLRDNGHRAFLVGGCVRDALLDIEPSEYDITTSAEPADIQELFERNVPIGESFGVILVLIDGLQFEVATFRRESEYTDGRRPSKVKYSKSEIEDVIRRDFTINGLLYDPIEEILYDHVDGERDLKDSVIRSIGNASERFKEDRLRMIRAVRFAARFDFKIDKQSLNAIKKLSGTINEVSSERIREEILKIITQKNPGNGVNMLSTSKLLEHILPEVSEMIGIEQPPEFHPEGDVFTHTRIVLDKLYEITGGSYSPELAMGALLHDIGKPPTFEKADRIRFNGHDRVGAEMAKTICKRLRLSKKQTERITSLIREHLKFKDALKMRESTLKRFISMPYFNEHLTMHLADCLGSHGITDVYEFLKDKIDNLKEEDIKPEPLINGNDLIELGFEPGPLFSKILHEIEEQQLEGILKNKEEAIKHVKEKFSP